MPVLENEFGERIVRTKKNANSFYIEWSVDKKLLAEELSDNGILKIQWLGALVFFLRWIAPVAIALVFLHESGLFGM